MKEPDFEPIMRVGNKLHPYVIGGPFDGRRLDSFKSHPECEPGYYTIGWNHSKGRMEMRWFPEWEEPA